MSAIYSFMYIRGLFDYTETYRITVQDAILNSIGGGNGMGEPGTRAAPHLKSSYCIVPPPPPPSSLYLSECLQLNGDLVQHCLRIDKCDEISERIYVHSSVHISPFRNACNLLCARSSKVKQFIECPPLSLSPSSAYEQ